MYGCVIQLPFQGGDALFLRLTANFGAGGAARAEKRIKRYISVSVIVPDGGKARRYPRDLLGQVSRVESAYDKNPAGLKIPPGMNNADLLLEHRENSLALGGILTDIYL